MTRQSLIDAAQRLFEERGLDPVPVAEIANAATVSVQTLFVPLAVAGVGIGFFVQVTLLAGQNDGGTVDVPSTDPPSSTVAVRTS